MLSIIVAGGTAQLLENVAEAVEQEIDRTEIDCTVENVVQNLAESVLERDLNGNNGYTIQWK